ncbi:MAG: hypothetical protein FK733_16310 [Asgard group archaeon]|nr:hypothetical protein [Asgard group archaeon]
MRKWLKFILPLMILCLFIPFRNVNAAFGVDIGDTYNYECIAAERTFSLGAETGTGEGFQIDGQHFDPGTIVTVEVIDLISDSVHYNVSSGGYNFYQFSDLIGLLASLRFQYIFYYAIATSMITDVNKWNQTFVEQDPGLLLYDPFIEIGSSTWEDIIEFGDGMVGYVSTISNLVGLTGDAEHDQNDDEFLCQYHIYGAYNETFTPYTSPYLPWEKDLLSIDHYYKYSYDKPNGVMLGSRMHGSTSGVVNGSTMSISYDFHVEQVGYDLPTNLIVGGLNGFTILITFVSLFIPVLIVRMKRKSIN